MSAPDHSPGHHPRRRGGGDVIDLSALDQGLNQHDVQMVFDFRDYHYAQNVFMVRTNQVKKDPEPFRLLMQAYNDAVRRMYADPSYALTTALKFWGQGTTEDVVRPEPDFYMKDEWKRRMWFTKELYDACKDVLLNSGAFPTNDFPSYELLTSTFPLVGRCVDAGPGREPQQLGGKECLRALPAAEHPTCIRSAGSE